MNIVVEPNGLNSWAVVYGLAKQQLGTIVFTTSYRFKKLNGKYTNANKKFKSLDMCVKYIMTIFTERKQTPFFIFYHELTLDQGKEFFSCTKNELLFRGREFAMPLAIALFKSLLENDKPVECWHCGTRATKWIIEKGKNEHLGKPTMNLFGEINGKIVLFNRDHIIPKSVGGCDNLNNLRPACSNCNTLRGNELSGEDLQFAKDHPELFLKERQEQGIANMRTSVENLLHNIKSNSLALEEIEKLMQPFKALNLI